MALSRAFIAPLVAVLGIIGLVAGDVTPASAEAARPWSLATSSSLSSDQGCANLLYVGVRGSDEHDGYGPTGNLVQKAIEDGLAARDFKPTVRQVYVDYTAASVDVLKNDVTNLALQILLFKKRTNFAYYDSIYSGYEALDRVLQDSLDRCPNERWVVSGYSQGALVAHHSLTKYANSARWAGSFLIGDPANYYNNLPKANKFGSASRFAAGNWDLSQPLSRFTIPGPLQTKVFSYCDAFDVVCDTNDTVARTLIYLKPGLNTVKIYSDAFNKAWNYGIGVHNGYVKGSNPTAVRLALRPLMDLLKNTVSAAPVPTSTPTSTPTPTPTTEAGVIKDAGLKACAIDQLKSDGVETADPTVAQVAQLVKLKCFSSAGGPDSIGSLEGLQYATKLGSFFGSGPVASLSPIAKLPVLKSIDLGSSKVATLAPLAGNTSLTSLSLTGAQISDVSTVPTILNLTYLNLDDNFILDVSPLNGTRFTGFLGASLRNQQIHAPDVLVGVAYKLPTITGFNGLKGRLSPFSGATGSGTITGDADSYSVTWTVPGLSQLQFADPSTTQCTGCGVGSFYVNFDQTVK